MKNRAAIYCFSLFAIAFLESCSPSSSSTSVASYRLIRPDLSLGEYLQVLDDENIVTASRVKVPQGLVKVNLKTAEIETLDEKAAEARDIKVSNGQIAYRVGDQIRLILKAHLNLNISVSRLRSFNLLNQNILITYDDLQHRSHFLNLNETGEVLNQGTLPGSVRDSAVVGPDIYVVYQNPDGLFFGAWHPHADQLVELEQIEAGHLGTYAALRHFSDSWVVGYLNDSDGTFKMARRSLQDRQWNLSVVDGEPNKNYRGMDIAIFNDHGRAGFLYLDAWDLQLRCARQSADGHWSAETLPFKGAVGFYTQIVKEETDSVTIAFHNFRSQGSDYQQTYLDLATADLSLLKR